MRTFLEFVVTLIILALGIPIAGYYEADIPGVMFGMIWASAIVWLAMIFHFILVPALWPRKWPPPSDEGGD